MARKRHLRLIHAAIVSRAEAAERLRSAARRVVAEAYSLGASRGELIQVIDEASNEVWGADGKDGDAG